MALVISDQFIKATHRTESELRLDLAIFFYQNMKMSMGKYAEKHFTVIGIGGILIRAKKAGFIPVIKPLLDQILTTTSFRLSQKIYNLLLKLANETSPE